MPGSCRGGEDNYLLPYGKLRVAVEVPQTPRQSFVGGVGILETHRCNSGMTWKLAEDSDKWSSGSLRVLFLLPLRCAVVAAAEEEAHEEPAPALADLIEEA